MSAFDVLGIASAALGLVALAIDAARYRASVNARPRVMDLTRPRGRA